MANECTVLSPQLKTIASMYGVNPHILASVIAVTSQKLGRVDVSLDDILEHMSESKVVKTIAEVRANQVKAFKKGVGLYTNELSSLQVALLLQRLKTYNVTHGTNYRIRLDPVGESTLSRPTIIMSTRFGTVNTDIKLNYRPAVRDFDYFKGGSDKENSTRDYAESAKLLKEQEDNEQFQLSNKGVNKLNKELNKKITLWLSRMGITYEAVDTITDRNGQPISAIAKADMLHKIIQIVEGKADVTTLSEEAAHFLVEMLEGNPLLDRLKGATKTSETYSRVQSEYAEVYKDDPNAEEKILKEAVGKLIAQEIVKIWSKDSPEFTPEKESLSLRISRFFQNLLNFLRERLHISNFSSEMLGRELNPFREAALKILNGETDNLTLREESKDLFYQLTAEDIVEKDRIKAALDAQRVYRDKTARSGYRRVSDNSEVPFRVSDLIKQYYLKIFRNPNKEETAQARMQAKKGTLLHLYEEHLMRAFYEGKTPTYAELAQLVYQELSVNPDFEGIMPDFYKMSSAQFDELAKGIKTVYNQIQKNQARINEQNGTNEKAILYFELPIMHENFAGTMDLVVLYSNGAVGIYDYKNMSFKEFNDSVINQVQEYKQIAFDSQITQYKNILFSGYGVKNFAETRIIPINVQYANNGLNKTTGEYTATTFRKIEIQGENDNREYLDQIPVAKELTDDAGLNKALEILYKELEALRRKSKKDYKDTSTRARADRVNKLIRNIIAKRDFAYAFAEVEDMVNAFHEREQKLPDDPNCITAEFLNDLKESIKVFIELATGAKDAIDATGDEELAAKRTIIQGQLLDLQNSVRLKSEDILRRSDPNNIDITTPGKTYRGLGLYFRTLSEIDHPVFKKLAYWVREAEDKTRQKTNIVIKKIQEKDTALGEWAKSQNMSKTDAFLKLYNRKTGNLFSRYSKKFWDDLDVARENQDTAFFLNYYEVALDKGVLRYTGEAQVRFEKALKNKEAYLLREYSGPENEAFRAAQLKKWNKEHNISVSIDALFNKNNYLLRRDYTKLDEYFSDEYNYIRSQQPLKDYYDLYVEMNQTFSDITGRRMDSNFVANIRASMIDNIAMNGIASVGTLTKSVLNSLELRDANAIYTEEELEKGNVDLDGRQIMHVPLFFTDNLRTPLTGSQRKDIIAEVGKKFHPSNPEYGIALQQAFAKAERENGLQNKSYDLSRSLTLMTNAVYNYKHMSEVENLAKLLLSEVKNKNVFSEIEQTEKTVINSFKGKVTGALGIPDDQVAALESFIDLYIYGKKNQSKMKTFTVGKKVDEYGNVISSGKTIAPQHMIEQAMQYTSAVTLGLKPILAIRNYVQVKSNLYMLATEGLYFNMQDDLNSTKEARTNPKKYYAAMAFFETQGNNLLQEKANKLSAKALSKYLTMDNLFIGLKLSDENVDRKVLVNMMMAYGINASGKVMKLTRMPGGDTRSLYDRMTIEENGDVSIEGLSKDEYTRFRTMAQQVSTKIKGTVPQEDRMLINTTIVGRLIMQYRSWMPGLIKARFSGIDYNPILDQVDMGRYLVGFQEITTHGKDTAKTLLQLVGASIPIIGFYFKNNMTVNEASSRTIYEEFKEANPLSTFTFEEFVAMRIGKMKSLALELQIIVALFMLQILAKGLIPDDKEKNPVEAFLTQTLFRSLNGAYLEASFFLNPYSATQIARSPLAITGFVLNLFNLFTNTGDELRDTLVGKDMKGILLWEQDSKDKTSPGYFASKLFPGVNAFTDFFDLYDTFSTYGGAR